MKLASRILVVIVSSAFVGATVFLVHAHIHLGSGAFGDLVDVYWYAFLVAAIALLLAPLLLLVQKLAPAGIRGGVVVGAALLGSVLVATLALSQWMQFPLVLPDLVGRTWIVYMYFIAGGLAYGAMWVLLVMVPLHVMHYKAACPSCETKVSRWILCSELTIYYRCRGCGMRMRVSSRGWVATFAGIVLVAACYFLYRDLAVSKAAAIGLILVQLALAIGLAPYVLPMQLAREKKRSHGNAT
jgi:hypothetical protein